MEEIFRKLLTNLECELIEFNGEENHVHLLIEYPPKHSTANIVNSLKGTSSRYLRKEFPIFKSEYWGDHSKLWSRSYFVSSVGGASIEKLEEYIKNQNTPN